MISSTPPPLASLDVEANNTDVQLTTANPMLSNQKQSNEGDGTGTVTSSGNTINHDSGFQFSAEKAIGSVVERISPIADIHEITGQWNYLYFAIAFCFGFSCFVAALVMSLNTCSPTSAVFAPNIAADFISDFYSPSNIKFCGAAVYYYQVYESSDVYAINIECCTPKGQSFDDISPLCGSLSQGAVCPQPIHPCGYHSSPPGVFQYILYYAECTDAITSIANALVYTGYAFMAATSVYLFTRMVVSGKSLLSYDDWKELIYNKPPEDKL